MRVKVVQDIIDVIRRKNCPRKPNSFEISYAQIAEDIAVKKAFEILGIKKFTYLDIGAHDARYLSNTYLFYKKGMRGVLVEPDPFLFKKIKAKRPKDICLNMGIGCDEADSAEFFIIEPRVLSTFSKEEAERYSAEGVYKVIDTIKMPLKNINSIIEENFEKCPDFISIDVEGLDCEIVRSLNFEKHRPTVICVETSEHMCGKTPKTIAMMDYILEKGYFNFAENITNAIFVDQKRWNGLLEASES